MQTWLYGIIILAIGIVLIFFYLGLVSVEKKVLESSDKIKKINEINHKYLFKHVNENMEIYKSYDNKSNFNRTTPSQILAYEVRNKILTYSRLLEDLKHNTETADEYISEINKINDEKFTNYHEDIKISKKRYTAIENRLYQSRIYSNFFKDVKVTVTMRYSSPKGQVVLYKNAEFNLNDLKAAYRSVSRKKLSKDVYDKIVKVERGLISDELRFDVFRRDNYRCKICGSSSDQGVQLHVDHVVPISKGGKSDFDNLQTLCERCNIGKSNKSFTNEKSRTCKKCQGELILRDGKNGKFYGCSNFPKCKYTESL